MTLIMDHSVDRVLGRSAGRNARLMYLERRKHTQPP